MDVLLETVSAEDLKKFEKIYQQQLFTNDVTPKVKFEYAWCLVRSKYPVDIKKGIALLQDLCTSDEAGQRDYLYYLAIGHARLKEFSKALTFIETFLSIEPENPQVLALETSIRKKMEREGLTGIAIASGVVLAVGAIVGLGIAAAKK